VLDEVVPDVRFVGSNDGGHVGGSGARGRCGRLVLQKE
jgi:hypothetical protein